jgi:hypothetical protein
MGNLANPNWFVLQLLFSMVSLFKTMQFFVKALYKQISIFNHVMMILLIFLFFSAYLIFEQYTHLVVDMKYYDQTTGKEATGKINYCHDDFKTCFLNVIDWGKNYTITLGLPQPQGLTNILYSYQWARGWSDYMLMIKKIIFDLFTFIIIKNILLTIMLSIIIESFRQLKADDDDLGKPHS